MDSTSISARSFLPYDKELVGSIESQWNDLLERYHYKGGRHGKIEIQFQEHSDGTVTKIRTDQNETGDAVLKLLCKESILDVAPFPAWTSDMKKMIGQDYREITITFNF